MCIYLIVFQFGAREVCKSADIYFVIHNHACVDLESYDYDECAK